MALRARVAGDFLTGGSLAGRAGLWDTAGYMCPVALRVRARPLYRVRVEWLVVSRRLARARFA